MSVCSADTARAAEASSRLQADQCTQQAGCQHPEDMQQCHAAFAAQQNSRVYATEQVRLSAVSIAEQQSRYAKEANDRANSFGQQAKHSQLAAQQAQECAQQKANRIAELERLVEQLIQQVMQLLAGIKRLALFVSCSLLAETHAGLTCMKSVPVGLSSL